MVASFRGFSLLTPMVVVICTVKVVVNSELSVISFADSCLLEVKPEIRVISLTFDPSSVEVNSELCVVSMTSVVVVAIMEK